MHAFPMRCDAMTRREEPGKQSGENKDAGPRRGIRMRDIALHCPPIKPPTFPNPPTPPRQQHSPTRAQAEDAAGRVRGVAPRLEESCVLEGGEGVVCVVFGFCVDEGVVLGCGIRDG
jgi:hypothetical protein